MAKPDDTSGTDILRASADLLARLNAELDGRLKELPAETQALLAQKGAVTQCVVRELRALLDAADARAIRYDALRAHVEQWLDGFLLPLKRQCENEAVDTPIYTTHLDRVIEDVRAALKADAPRDP